MCERNVCDKQTDRQISQNWAFPLAKCIDDTCRTGRWSFWSWFDVYHHTGANKRFLCFLSQVLWPLTCRPQIFCPSYFCPGSYIHWIRGFHGFPVSRKLEAREWTDRSRQTDGRTGATLNAVPEGGLH